MTKSLTVVQQLMVLVAWFLIGSRCQAQNEAAFVGPLQTLKIELVKKLDPDSVTLTELKGEALLNFKDIKDIVALKKPKSISELLSYLPPRYLASYTLVYNSRSLQEASFQNPRVIVYGSDARLVLSFNGNEEQKKGNSVEIMEFFKGYKTEFRFHEIVFKSEQAQIRENVKSCTACHREDARPIWDSYALWPGVYGSHDDNISSATDHLIKLENTEFKKWRDQKENHPRYRWLPKIQFLAQGKYPRTVKRSFIFQDGIVPKVDYDALENSYPYSPETLSVDLTRIRTTYPFSYVHFTETASYDGGYLIRPNLSLSLNFSKMQAEKILSQMRKTNLVKKYPLVFKSHLDSINALFEKESRANSPAYSHLGQMIDDAIELRRSRLHADLPSSINDPIIKDDFERKYISFAPIIQAYSDFFGIPVDQFNLALEKNMLVYVVGVEDMMSLLSHTSEGQKFFAEFKEALKQSPPNDLEKQRAEYFKETGRTLNLKLFATPNSSSQTGPFQKCLACHTGEDSVGPLIPFNDSAWMANLRARPQAWSLFSRHLMSRIDKKGSGRMPLDDILTQTERDEIVRFLEGNKN